MNPMVVITGRSNVGKSSLFNKIIESKNAIVQERAGTTRDYLEAKISWRKSTFILVDTGGLDPIKDDEYRKKIIKQTERALEKASIILFVVDSKVGPIPGEKKNIYKLKKTGKNIFVVSNKCDNKRLRSQIEKFKTFNLPIFPVSSVNGSGIGDLLDEIIKNIPKSTDDQLEPEITIALIGKPNVGKSTIFNVLAKEERMIVSDVPHTTRDSQHIIITHKNITYKIIDTAGIRRKTKQGGIIEKMSIEKTKYAIKKADVVALIVDISQQITSQEKRLAREIQKLNKKFLIVVNKWDLAEKKNIKTTNEYKKWVAHNFPNLSRAPVIFCSSINKQNVQRILSTSAELK